MLKAINFTFDWILAIEKSKGPRTYIPPTAAFIKWGKQDFVSLYVFSLKRIID